MKTKRKFFHIIIIILALFILIEIGSRILQSPNLVKIETEEPFLLETSWHQIGGYAKHVAHDSDAGCWATAIAQIAHYHKLSPSGDVQYLTSNGESISVDLDDFSFQHELFTSRIDEQTNSIAVEQVSRYIFYVAALIYTDFGSSGYLEHETMMSRIEKHLNCEVGFYEYTKEKYLENQPVIIRLIKQEIDADRPMMIYFDNGKDFGHAAAIDGYLIQDDQFLIHLNMGWGGRHNGWYKAFKKFIGVRNDLQNRFLITFDPLDKVLE